MPSRRSRWSAEDAETLVAVQTPITAAPSATGPSADDRPDLNMKKATVAKNNGHRIARKPSNADCESMRKCRSQP